MASSGGPERYHFGSFEVQLDERRLGGEEFLALKAEQESLSLGALT